jgi:hypothetical protein
VPERLCTRAADWTALRGRSTLVVECYACAFGHFTPSTSILGAWSHYGERAFSHARCLGARPGDIAITRNSNAFAPTERLAQQLTLTFE